MIPGIIHQRTRQRTRLSCESPSLYYRPLFRLWSLLLFSQRGPPPPCVAVCVSMCVFLNPTLPPFLIVVKVIALFEVYWNIEMNPFIRKWKHHPLSSHRVNIESMLPHSNALPLPLVLIQRLFSPTFFHPISRVYQLANILPSHPWLPH